MTASQIANLHDKQWIAAILIFFYYKRNCDNIKDIAPEMILWRQKLYMYLNVGNVSTLYLSITVKRNMFSEAVPTLMQVLHVMSGRESQRCQSGAFWRHHVVTTRSGNLMITKRHRITHWSQGIIIKRQWFTDWSQEMLKHTEYLTKWT